MNLNKILLAMVSIALLMLQSCREADVVELSSEPIAKQELLKKTPKQDSIIISSELPHPKDPTIPPGK